MSDNNLTDSQTSRSAARAKKMEAWLRPGVTFSHHLFGEEKGGRRRRGKGNIWFLFEKEGEGKEKGKVGNWEKWAEEEKFTSQVASSNLAVRPSVYSNFFLFLPFDLRHIFLPGIFFFSLFFGGGGAEEEMVRRWYFILPLERRKNAFWLGEWGKCLFQPYYHAVWDTNGGRKGTSRYFFIISSGKLSLSFLPFFSYKNVLGNYAILPPPFLPVKFECMEKFKLNVILRTIPKMFSEAYQTVRFCWIPSPSFQFLVLFFLLPPGFPYFLIYLFWSGWRRRKRRKRRLPLWDRMAPRMGRYGETAWDRPPQIETPRSNSGKGKNDDATPYPSNKNGIQQLIWTYFILQNYTENLFFLKNIPT